MSGPIVLGYDASPAANAALARTIELASELGSTVVVVFGYYISPLGGRDIADYRRELKKLGTRTVDRAIADLEGAGVDASARVEAGKPAEVIVQVAQDVGATLIAVGSEGESPVAGAILGSVVLKLVQHTPVPLLIVPVHG